MTIVHLRLLPNLVTSRNATTGLLMLQTSHGAPVVLLTSPYPCPRPSPPRPWLGLEESLLSSSGANTMVRSGESVQSGLSNASPPSSASSPPRSPPSSPPPQPEPPEPTPTITTRKAVGGSAGRHAASFATPFRPSTFG